jgi:uncharacterized lipoprotein YmbA
MAWTFVIAMAFFTGCRGATTKVEFYRLNADRQGLEDEQIEVMDQTIAIGVGPMEFPKTIDRSQIVIRIGTHRFEVDEFRRWAGSLREDFLEVLTVNLSILLRSNHVAAYPWEEFFNPDYRIFMDVHEFVGDLGGSVILAVTWTITDAEGRKALLARKSIIREPVLGTDFEAYVI